MESFSIMTERYFFMGKRDWYLLRVDGNLGLVACRLVLFRFHRSNHLLELVLVLAEFVAHYSVVRTWLIGYIRSGWIG